MTNEYNFSWNIFGIWILKSVFQLPLPHTFAEIYMLPPSLRLWAYIVPPSRFTAPSPPDNYCTVP